MQLSGADRRALRALGNAVKPTVFVGKEGVTDAVLRAIDDGHRTEELLKVRVLDTCPLHRKDVASRIAAQSASSMVQLLGRTILLFRAHPEEPKIVLPSARPAR